MIRQLIFALAPATVFVVQPSVAADGVRNVVLVHGAFADGSSWAKVIPLLQKAGLNAVAVQNPLTSFADDVAATKRAIALQDGPVILVGHSWGGVVITEAGIDEKVAGLVYVAAFAPDAGEVVGELGKGFPEPPGLGELRPDAEGYLTMTTKGVSENFAPDLPRAQQKLVAATQGTTNGTVFGAKVTNVAWKTRPSWYIVAGNDRMINPDRERKFAKDIKAKTTTIASSHVAMLSHPEAVAKVIIDAAKNAPAKR
ncbi:MAG TPA: alpha/beta hydrolase [Burkholderiales bacterium]|nr:alpha/beta hydrolase [Burkholderiales bacterium]